MVCSLKWQNHGFAFLCMLDGSGGIIVNDIILMLNYLENVCSMISVKRPSTTGISFAIRLQGSEQKFLCYVQAL